MKILLIILYNIVSCSAKLEFPDYRDHECKRTCNNVPLTCRYNFTIEWIYSMGSECLECTKGKEEDCLNSGCILVDGNGKLAVVANRMLPGPSIEVCLGDTIIVDVFNNLHDVTTTIHWHGQHQRGTPWMDGVPMVTQCPIQPMTTFRYRYKADNPGTHFWHSHSGTQRSQGLFGPLVVREQQQRALYDFDLSEHIITVMEWTDDSLKNSFYKLYSGKMRTARKTVVLINGVASVNTSLPTPIFEVEKGFKYRFRIINNGFMSSPVHLKIQNHNLTVVSVDGCYVDPVNVDTITLINGERIDFILEANQENDYYWIDFTLNKAEKGFSLLKYKGTSNNVPAKESFKNITETKIQLNCIDSVFDTEQTCTEYTELKSLDNPSEHFQGEPNFKYYINVDMFKYARPEYQGMNDSELTSSTLNNITFKSPTTNLIESERGQNLCNAESRRNCDSKFSICDCTHMVEIPYQNLVEIILIDKGDRKTASHPIHLHGYKFQIIGGEKLELPITEKRIKELDANGELKRNLAKPPFKDVITVPVGGYAILRFFSDNPGYWFLHCHLDYHMMTGMAMILKVGNPPKPPASFPKCGNYLD